MEKLTNEQKEQMIKDFENKQDKMIRTGKIIVIVIASVNIIMTIITFIGNFNLFSLIIQIVLSIALLSGVAWVRYLFAVSAAMGTIILLYILTSGEVYLTTPFVIISLVAAAYTVICSILLFTSKCVSEYMYAVKH